MYRLKAAILVLLAAVLLAAASLPFGDTEASSDSRLRYLSQDPNWGVFALNFDKSEYSSGEDVYFQMSVLDSVGHILCDADIVLTITTPDNKQALLSTSDGSIQVSEECSKHGKTYGPDYYAHYIPEKEGTYYLELSATTAAGTRTMLDFFVVEDNAAFYIERDGPTRIFPFSNYTMNIGITANMDYDGKIYELLPGDFDVTRQEDFEVMDYGIAKILVWQKQMEAGQSYNLSYEFDAPDPSPEFYLLGNLRSSAFNEGRYWQIASDAWTLTSCTMDLPSGSVNINTGQTFTMQATGDETGSGGGACAIDFYFRVDGATISTTPGANPMTISGVNPEQLASGACKANCQTTQHTVTGNNAGTYTVTVYCNATVDCGTMTSSGQTVTITAVDTVKPNVTALIPVAESHFDTSTSIEISANVSDDVGVLAVRANITRPDSTVVQITLDQQGGTPKYNTSYSIPNITGIYTVRIIANDTTNNTNTSQTTNFTANVLPVITSLTLNTTDVTKNDTNQNLTSYVTLTDSDEPSVKIIYNWFRNGTSLTVLNMPFEGINLSNSSNNLRDYSVYGNNGVFNDIHATLDPLWNATSGHDNKGVYYFHGTTSIWINIEMQSFSSGAGTITAWAKANATPTRDWYIIGRNIAGNTAGDVGLLFSFSNNKMEFYAQDGANTRDSFADNTGVDTNWHFYAGAWNSSETALYIDGVKQTDVDLGISLSAHASRKFGIGMPNGEGNSADGTPWEGYIDDIQIFNRTLSQQEIIALNNSQYSIFVSQELLVGDVWNVSATPNDGNEDGSTTTYSLNVTILPPPESVVDTSISASTLSFGTLDPTSNNNPASENPIIFTNTANSNTAVDVYMNASHFSGAGTIQTFGNLSVWNLDAAAASKNFNYSTWINYTGSNQGVFENIAVSSTVNLYFWLDIPGGQTEGAYVANVTLRSVVNGDAP